MPGIIAWETHSGEEVERAIATYICLLNPRASRVRPSVGDGGMDVLVTNADSTRDIYQIKKYATNLTSRQKRDVEESFGSMLDYTAKVGYEVRQWHLVMPLDYTKENLSEWFEEFTKGYDFECIWDGKARIDGWAASMPQVGDYYFEDGMRYVQETIRESLSAARLSDSTSWPEIKESISAQQKLLDERDPHYSYSFHSYSAYELYEPEFHYRPGLVMSIAEGEDGAGWVVMDVIAKHSASSQLVPITGTFTVKPASKEESDALQAFLDYGIPLPEMSGCVSDGFSDVFSNGVKDRDGRLWTFQSPDKKPYGPDSIRLRSRHGGQLELLRVESGSGGKGEYWEGRDKSGLVALRYYLDYNSTNLQIGLSLTDEPDAVASVEDALASLFCLHDAAQEDEIMFIGKAGNGYEQKFSAFNISSDRVELLYSLMCDMAAFNRYSYSPVPLPFFKQLTHRDVAQMREAIQFCDGRACCLRYEQWSCSIFGDATESDEPSLILSVSPLVVALQGEEYQLGQCVDIFVGVRETVDEGGLASIVPVQAYGNHVIRLYPKHQPKPKTRNHIALSDAPAPEDWLAAIDGVKVSYTLAPWLEDACENLLGMIEEWCA